MAADPCEPTSTLDRIESTADGLLLYATGELAPRIEKTRASIEPGFESVFELMVDFPGTQLGRAPAEGAWETGPFAAMRIVRYRTPSECGLRMRLVARRGELWIVERRGALFFIGAKAARFTAGERAVAERNNDSGAAVVSANMTSVRIGSRTRTDAVMQGGFAQRAGPSTVVGTIGINPSTNFAAVGVQNVPVSVAFFDAAAGDLATRFGDTGKGGASSITQMSFRGGGVNVRWPGRFTGQVFGGRSSQVFLVRVDGGAGTESRPIRSRLFGAQLGWTDANDVWGFGAGWVRTTARGEDPQENVHLSAAYDRGARFFAHLTLEESLRRTSTARWLTGYAATFEPRSETQRLSMGGYFRIATREFRAPAAASFFAGLRHSYSLYGSYRPLQRLSISAGLGQTKTFNLLDPRNVGTLHDQKSGSVSYGLTDHVSMFAEVLRSSAVSDPGAQVEENSRLRRSGGGALFGFRQGYATARVSRDIIEDRTARNLQIELTRFDIDAARFLRDHGEVQAGVQYLTSKQAAANDLLSGNLLYRAPSRTEWSGEGELRETVTFAGGVAVRQFTAAMGVRHQATESWLNGAARIAYQRVSIRHQPPRDAVVLLFTTDRRFGWGPGPRPTVPYTSGALPLLLRATESDFLARVVVRVFEDRDQNGNEGAGEPSVAGIVVSLDGRRGTTGADGEIDFNVVPGKHKVDFVTPLPTADYLIPSNVPHIVDTAPGQMRTVTLPLVRAVSLQGHVEFVGGPLSDPSVLEGIRISAASSAVRRTATTDRRGDFDFGRVPTGKYMLTIDRETLARETIALEPTSQEVVLTDVPVVVTFRIRRATARERFGTPEKSSGLKVVH